MKLTDKRADERPREKLKSKGASALSDLELLQALIGSGNAQADVTAISKAVLKLLKENNGEITHEMLSQIQGVGPAKATELLAAFELAHRYLIDSEQPVIDSPEKAVEQLEFIRNKKQEYFVCLTLDGANRLIAKRVVTIGTLNASLVHPREVFADAITDRAASIIVAHNHPSGTLNPSDADVQVTQKLKDSSKLLGIDLVDHLVLSKDTYISIINNY